MFPILEMLQKDFWVMLPILGMPQIEEIPILQILQCQKQKQCGTQASAVASVLPFLRFVANNRIYVYPNNQTITFITLILKIFIF